MFHVYILYFYLCFFGFIYLLVRWKRSAASRKERLQARFLIIVLLTVMIAAGLEAALLPIFTSYRSRGLAPLIFFFWTAGIAYSIFRYRFLGIVPRSAMGTDLIHTIDAPILLLREDLTVALLNTAVEKLIGIDSRKILNSSVSGFIADPSSLLPAVKKLRAGNAPEITFRTRFRGSTGTAPFADLRLLNVRDRFGDILGTLVIAKAVSGQKALAETYRLTGRELEVL
jgi:PAS domain-containing protein